MLAPDAEAIRMGAPADARGARSVAHVFSGRALAAEVAIVDGSIGMAWVVNGTPRVVWNVFIDEHQIVDIDMHADQDRIAALEVSIL
jgi:RNA polymerase sigma-70 factor (ECF subfamily)